MLDFKNKIKPSTLLYLPLKTFLASFVVTIVNKLIKTKSHVLIPNVYSIKVIRVAQRL